MAPIEELPTEILLDIVSWCTPNDLKHLIKTCRSLYDALIPEVYRKVDLSSHNTGPNRRVYKHPDGLLVFMGNDMHDMPRDISKRHLTDLDREVFQKQRSFIRAMECSPALGCHVRELHWTVLDASDKYWGAVENDGPHTGEENVEDGSYEAHKDSDRSELGQRKPDRKVYEPEDEPLWRTFKSMVNVSVVDLCWIREWREVTLPGPLFESATSIKLGGRMTLDFIHCILGGLSRASSVGKRLEHLHLNAIMGWCETDIPLPKFNHLRELTEYYDAHKGEDFVVEPNRGLLAGIVDPLIDHYSALTSLHITTVEDCRAASLTETYEDSLYRSWARFIRSVREGLTKLVFEQVTVPRRDPWSQCSGRRYFSPSQFGRQMEKMFFFYILPVLAEGPWPRMKRMEILGLESREISRTAKRVPSDDILSVPYIDYTVTPRHVGISGTRYRVCQRVTPFPTAEREQVAKLIGENAELVVRDETGSIVMDDFLIKETGIPSNNKVSIQGEDDEDLLPC